MYLDETTLMAWIADWELDGIEFKQILDLETKDRKGEFVKDIIALANSAPHAQEFTGYLIVGVSNERMIVGTVPVEEERVQQIARTYIHPPISLRCSSLSTQVPGWLQVSVIEVKGMNRPYSVARAIGKLEQGEVFVRNGSVVERATKEDIIRMANEAQATAEVERYVKAAQKHMELGNYAEAIEIYTLALRVFLSAELFLARGKARRMFMESHPGPDNDRMPLAKQALEDLTRALSLAEAFNIQKEARLERVRLYNAAFVGYDDWEEDFTWLQKNTTGQEHGEVIFRYYWALSDNSGIDDPAGGVSAMNEVLRCGYSHPKVLELRAEYKYALYDCYSALQDIDAALQLTTDQETQVSYLSLKANILAKMGKFEDAHRSFEEARRLQAQHSKKAYSDPIGSVAFDLEDEILWRYALEAKFGQHLRYAPVVVSALLEEMGAERWLALVAPFPKLETKVESGVTHILRKYGLVLDGLEKIVGKDFWRRWRSGTP